MGVLVRYLLDSHVFLWLDDLDRLAVPAREIFADRQHDLYLSVASVWELAIKRAAGKLRFTGSFAAAAKAYGITLLPVAAEHAVAIERLPSFHKDLFDRMLIAQAQVEDLVLVTHDEVITRYPVASLRV